MFQLCTIWPSEEDQRVNTLWNQRCQLAIMKSYTNAKPLWISHVTTVVCLFFISHVFCSHLSIISLLINIFFIRDSQRLFNSILSLLVGSSEHIICIAPFSCHINQCVLCVLCKFHLIRACIHVFLS